MDKIRITKSKKMLLIKVLNRQSYACLIQHNNIFNINTRHSDIQRSRYKFEFGHLLLLFTHLTFRPSAVPIPNVKFAGHIANYLPIYFHQRLLCISIKIASYTFSLNLLAWWLVCHGGKRHQYRCFLRWRLSFQWRPCQLTQIGNIAISNIWEDKSRAPERNTSQGCSMFSPGD